MNSSQGRILSLDTDAIIKMNFEESNLFEEVINLFDKVYLHQRVYQEVKWPKEVINKLDDLIKAQKITLMTDKQLMTRIGLREYFFISLKEVCEIFGVDYYEEYYTGLLSLESEDKILKAIKRIDKQLNDIGEIKTLQMIILLRDIANKEINYFLSDDRRARRAIVLTYGNTLKGNKISGLSVLAAFDLLREKGLSKNKALDYVNKLPNEKNKIYNKNKNMVKLDNETIIDKLYGGELKKLITGDFMTALS